MSKIKLGETEYDVPKMNIGQLEEVTVALDLPAIKRPFAILRIAFARSTPKVDVNSVEATNAQIAAAITEILSAAGFAKAVDPNAAAPGQPGTEKAES